ncbi:MAG: hypothetical protein HN350_02395 [Phycisphaerales bacterium]|jgi:hypothetical protein|nr:hypothetical protein [Phycisphaerales bacterium]
MYRWCEEPQKPRRRPRPVLRSYWPFWMISVLHAIVALSYKYGAGLSITAHPLPGEQTEYWDKFWQALPIESLRDNLGESVWNLHSQPPLHNLYGGVMAKLFYPNHLDWMHLFNIALGACIPAFVGVIVWRITRNKFGGILAGLLYALYPSLFLYEAYPLYTLPTAFLVTASMFCLAMFVPERKVRWLYMFLVCVNLLILTRSAYHLVILLAIIPFVVMQADAKRLRVLAIALLISTVSIGWYSKNYVQFGFFGSSSWSGQGAWRITGKDYTPERKAELLERGVIEPVAAEVHPFSPPSAYRDYGFDQTSDIDVLNRDDLNNINIIAISQAYQRSAIGVLRDDPKTYVKNIARAYRAFCVPSSQYLQVSENAAKISDHEWVASRVFQGQWVCKRLERRVGFDYFRSLWFFIIPLMMLGYLVSSIRRCGVRFGAWVKLITRDPVTSMAMFLIVYSTGVCCMAELGENMRFKFLIESLLWLVAIGLVVRLLQGRRLAGDDLEWAGPSD